MRKGLLLTLVMVAIALSGYQALGRAPTISNIRDIVVGDADTATPPNTFVYPNAIDLNDKVSDIDGSDDQITWSFYEGSGTYQINGVDTQATSTLTAQIDPANKIAGPSVTANDPDDTDANNLTATIRNATLSPISGPNTDPGANNPEGFVDGTDKLVTLFASDGSSVGEKSFMVYTANDENDHTSPPTAIPTPCLNFDLRTTTGGFRTVKSGTGTFSSADGICIEVPGPGNNDLEWRSEYGTARGLELVDNAVWRCRVTAHNAGNVEETVPLWVFLFENGSQPEDTLLAGNVYGGEFVFLDASGMGGANTVGIARTNFEVWITPMAVQTAAWRDTTSGAFAPESDLHNDMRIRFRVFDVATSGGSSTGFGAENDLGSVCWDALAVDRFSLVDLIRGDVVYEDTALSTDTGLPLAEQWYAKYPSATTVTVDTGGVTLTPVLTNPGTPGVTGWLNQTIELFPGDGSASRGDYTKLTTDYPVPWEADTLYMVEFVMSAPGPVNHPNGLENQADIIRVGMDSATQEIGGMVLVDNNNMAASGPAMTSCPATPKSTPDTFTAFLFSHNVTLVGETTAHRLRPRADLINAATFGTANGMGGLDSIKYHSCKVTKVTF